ncbi:MAG: EAL domain-containing protein [Romboutsia sp.]|uniref:EAL domain-containing protein n=1 Tax=Romboutsia sp. TaxID=1965302 RepID=UPI003F3996E6
MISNQDDKYMKLKDDIIRNKKIKNTGFTLVYQPKVDIENKKIISWEVLSRWNHPNYGVVSPLEFIQIIKDLKKEYEFDMYVFENMCKDISTTSYEGNTYSINISTNTLKVENVEKDIIDISKKYNIDPKLIIFEIVEGSEIEAYEIITSIVNKLNRLGYRISIDDFGTGYSSYYRLCNLNFNEIKIPREFLPTEGINKERQIKVLKSIVEMGKSLGCKIVIEGIETLENHQLAQMLGIDYGQGYLYSHPVSFDECLNIRKNG